MFDDEAFVGGGLCEVEDHFFQSKYYLTTIVTVQSPTDPKTKYIYVISYYSVRAAI